MSDYEEILNVAQHAAENAAEIIRKIYRTSFDVEFKAPRDPVTTADRQANDLICAHLQKHFPEIPCVAEESDPNTFEEYRRSARVFFVDPLDGTRDFVRRNDEFVVMIGLLEDERPALGLVLAPVSKTLWVGHGSTAYRQDASGERRSLSVSSTEGLAEARLVTTRSHRGKLVERALEVLSPARVDALGSAGLKFAEVAQGAADAYVAPGFAGSRWDACAGEAIVRAAGGCVTDTLGGLLDYRDADLGNRNGIVASNGRFHEVVLARVAQAKQQLKS